VSIIADSSPLIHLAAAGDFDLLRTVFGRVLVPETVIAEVTDGGHGRPGDEDLRGALGTWIIPVSVRNAKRVGELVAAGLHRGEAEVIVSAQEVEATGILVDDQAAVLYARRAGLVVTRTPAVYFAAKKAARIDSVREGLDRLRSGGFRLSNSTYREILAQAGELDAT
jgi:predicted nucleic acid-binding protein